MEGEHTHTHTHTQTVNTKVSIALKVVLFLSSMIVPRTRLTVMHNVDKGHGKRYKREQEREKLMPPQRRPKPHSAPAGKREERGRGMVRMWIGTGALLLLLLFKFSLPLFFSASPIMDKTVFLSNRPGKKIGRQICLLIVRDSCRRGTSTEIQTSGKRGAQKAMVINNRAP